MVIPPRRWAVPCPEECLCFESGYNIDSAGSGLNSIPPILPKNVGTLKLDDNNVTIFENDSFVSRGLVNLVILSAGFCKIRRIELGAFNGLTNLTYLSMYGNEISEIIPGTFEKLRSLENLDLARNIIEHLEFDTFSGLVNVKYTRLLGNELQYLHPDTFVGLPNLQNLHLSHNTGLQIPTDRHFISSHSLNISVYQAAV